MRIHGNLIVNAILATMHGLAFLLLPACALAIYAGLAAAYGWVLFSRRFEGVAAVEA